MAWTDNKKLLEEVSEMRRSGYRLETIAELVKTKGFEKPQISNLSVFFKQHNIKPHFKALFKPKGTSDLKTLNTAKALLKHEIRRVSALLKSSKDPNIKLIKDFLFILEHYKKLTAYTEKLAEPSDTENQLKKLQEIIIEADANFQGVLQFVEKKMEEG